MSLLVSIITSICSNGLKATLDELPDRARMLDFYAFMQSDLEIFFPSDLLHENGRRRNACEVMAAAQGKCASSVADKIHYHVGDRKIIAISSFIPEIAAHSTNDVAIENSRKALIFLIELARELRRAGHQVRALELVGGSCLDGVWCGKNKRDQVFMVNRLSKDDSLRRLIDRLVPIAEEAAKAELGIVPLALELEPGPLFALDDRASLSAFCSLLAVHENPAINKVIGVNLDIPHWGFLGDISPMWLRREENRLIRDRIVHAHISDHTKGHFCDLVPEKIHRAEDFVDWIKILNDLPRQQTDEDYSDCRIKYSGFVSIELECCQNGKVEGKTTAIEKAWVTVNEWCV